jgi:hypothetical protein
VEGINTTGCCLVLPGAAPVPCSTWHDDSHLGLGGPLPCSQSFQMKPPSATRTPGLAFGGPNKPISPNCIWHELVWWCFENWD